MILEVGELTNLYSQRGKVRPEYFPLILSFRLWKDFSFLSILFFKRSKVPREHSFSAYKKYYTGSNRLNMGLNRINMCLFTLSLTELLIGIAAQGRRALWGWHQSHMTRTAVICVCGKTPSTKHCLYYQQIYLLELSSEAGRKYWKEVELGFVEC